MQRVESPTTGRQAIRLTRASPAEAAAFSRRQVEVRVGQRKCLVASKPTCQCFPLQVVFFTQATVQSDFNIGTGCLAPAGSRHMLLAFSDMCCCTLLSGLQTVLLSRCPEFRVVLLVLACSPRRSHMQERVAAIQDAAGFTAVFEAMRASGKPAIGHNMSLDLTFSLAAFAGPLPGRWPDYKLMVQHWLPGTLLPGPRACTCGLGLTLAACLARGGCAALSCPSSAVIFAAGVAGCWHPACQGI